MIIYTVINYLSYIQLVMNDSLNKNSLTTAINNLAEGYSEVWYHGDRYGVSKSIFNQGKSIKVFARQLGGNHFISFNYYIKSDSYLLKPCEMPESIVLDFLKKYNDEV